MSSTRFPGPGIETRSRTVARRLLAGVLSPAIFIASSACTTTTGGDGLPPLPPPPRVGDVAPALAIEDWISPPGTPGDRSPAPAPGGAVVVLEFWATWCAPCRAAMPHLNALAEQFRDRPVRFISITDEKRDVVEKFLRTHPMGTWIAMDTDRSTYLSYRVGGLPHTVVIDQRGIVREITYPMALRAEYIEDLLE